MNPLKTSCFALALLAASTAAQTNVFELAATIYDTDAAVHPDFSCSIYLQGIDEGNGLSRRGSCAEGPEAYSGESGNLKPNCLGVVKGLVELTLNPTTKKIEYSGNDPKGCWTSEEWFNKAFTSTPGINVEHCYNIPFTQVNDKFEFDSDKMLNANGKLVGGFFPDVLHNAPDDPDCPSCNTKRTAERFNLLDSTRGGWEQWATKAQYDSLVNAFYEYKSKEGDFADGSTTNKNDILGANYLKLSQEGANGDIYDWTSRRTSAGWNWYLYGNTAIKNEFGNASTTYDPLSKANQHFCFESHANFVYSPEQVFYISGDDEIWVYINNELAIDLGGNHMAAPDHINLYTLELTEGETYPLDIFFCHKRTQGSDLRISTNIPLTQAQVTGTCGSTPPPPTVITRSPASNIKARVNANTILLENLPANAKVELYNLQGKRIYSAYSENSEILRILVQTKGMYIVKIGTGNILRVSVM